MSGMFQKKTLPKGGIPVLFIPGNSGSAKQVRSLASVALRKALEMDKKYRTRFDFFAVDFDEELSALSGSVLKDQHEFVIKSIGRDFFSTIFRQFRQVNCRNSQLEENFG